MQTNTVALKTLLGEYYNKLENSTSLAFHKQTWCDFFWVSTN